MTTVPDSPAGLGPDQVSRPAPVPKRIGGIDFMDPYDHLQADNDAVLAWQWAESEKAEAYARSLPGFDDLVGEIAASYESPITPMPVKCAGWWYATRFAPDLTGHQVVRSREIDGAAEVVCEPAQLGGTVDVPAFVYKVTPSPDGRYVVATVMPDGSLNARTHVVDVDKRAPLPSHLDVLIYLGYAEPCWTPDSREFLVGDRSEDRLHRVRRVAVAGGDMAVDDYVFSADEVSLDIPVLTHHVSPGGRFCVGVSAPHEKTAAVIGDLERRTWRRFVPSGFKGECHGDWLDDETYVAIDSSRFSRGRIVRIPVERSLDPDAWIEIAPAGDPVLRCLSVRSGRLVVGDLMDVAFRLRVMEADGSGEWVAPVGRFGASNLTFPPRIVPKSEAFLFSVMSFTDRPTVYSLDAASRAVEVAVPAREGLKGLSVEQHFAVSKDGTRIPYFLVGRDDLDRGVPQPTLMRGYGGFNLPLGPFYLSELIPFVRCGGVYVQANLRGGGEYGAAWHDAGRLHHKQNTFDDCYAIAEKLIADGITTRDQLVLQGASNGGLLAGVGAVQRPDLFGACIPQAPLLEMMQPFGSGEGEEAERSRAVFVDDYGDPTDPEDAKVIHAYSPYHNIKDGTAYPAVYQQFGENDLACPANHGRKFTARMQRATTSDRPVLLRVWRRGGHGGSSDPLLMAKMTAEWLAFAFLRSGLDYVAPPAPDQSPG